MSLTTTLAMNLDSLPILDTTVLLGSGTNILSNVRLTDSAGLDFRLAVVGGSLTISVLLVTLLWHRNRKALEKLKAEVRSREAAYSKVEDLSLHLSHTQKLNSLSTLSAGVAHDFNNNLQAISTFAVLTKSRISDETDAHHYLDTILKLTQQGSVIARGLLDLNGKDEIVKSVHSLPTLIQETTEMARYMLPASIEICSEMPKASGSILVEMNESQMKQVLLNLVINARDAMPNGGRLVVRLDKATPEATHAQLSVSDTGVGMSDEVKTRIFEPFFTTKERGHGTGLGMSMAYGIVKDHDGTIEIDSRVGSGTTVRILLPIVREEKNRDEDSFGPRFGSNGALVVLAEDHEQDRAGVKARLEQMGFQVHVVVDCPRALQVYRDMATEPKLILMDLDLPRIDGRRCLETLREKGVSAPSIFMTDLSSNEVSDGSVLYKPFSDETFVKTIAYSLQGSNS